MSVNLDRKRDRFCSGGVWVMVLAVSVTLLSLSSACAADKSQPTGKIDEQRLVGRWLRPDGGYILDLQEASKDGTLKAAYLNPRPINIAKAMFSRKDGTLVVSIELRDVNYPGSRYRLEYDPKTDRFMGTYFQAVQGETYNVSFVRVK